MNDDGSKHRYVSTFRMHIKPCSASPASGTGPGSNDNGAADKCTHKGSPNLASCYHLEPPLFIKLLQDCCVDEGSDIILQAAVTGSQPIKVSWLHNGEVARFGIPSFESSEVSFVVRESLPEDAGAYTCLAENRAGKTSSCAAVFVRDFETIYGVQNHASNIFTCASESILENGRSPTITTCSENLSPVTNPGEVIPKKRANSGTGPLLRFENPPQHVKVQAGLTARLKCVFSGSPPTVSCWIRNKEQIVDGPELWADNTDLSSTLVIAEAKSHNTGCYTVVIRDRKSSAQHTVTLSVIERPQPPASCPVISLVTATSLVLSWSGPCYDGGSAIVGYVVEVKSQGQSESGDWSQLTGHCKSTSYRVRAGLQAQQGYSFRVRAYNEVGVSEPGPVSPVVHMEQKCKPQDEEAHQDYVSVSVDSTHKVTDHYYMQEKLGMGRFGLVFKLTHKETGRICAGKFYKGRRAKEREAARKEIELMNHLHHPKLVRCFAAYDHSPEMVMIMEFIAGGELFERIVDDSFEHTEPASVHYMQQILQGISFMHQQNIVHLDLKPENIVCVDTAGTSIKIIDFGLACTLDAKTPLKVMHGTPEFVAPEVINYEPVCLATDMWSIGVICYIFWASYTSRGKGSCSEKAAVTGSQPIKVSWLHNEYGHGDSSSGEVSFKTGQNSHPPVKHFTESWLVAWHRRLSGESPFQGDSDTETLALVTAAEWEFDEESFDEITDAAKNFISSLVNKDTRRRMSSGEALAHAWMAAFDSGDLETKNLSKEKMKRFLARQKWKKAGKAVLALKRMALLSKGDGAASPTSPGEDSHLSPEAEHALLSLEHKMHGPPQFTASFEDQTVPRGASVHLSCQIKGYPDPEVVWLRGEEPVVESPTVQIEYEEDGRCTLTITKVGHNDSNVYTCRATNDHGETLSSAKLVVL